MVVDAPDGGGLAAATLLLIQRGRGRLSMLVVAERYEGTGLEQQVIEMAEALCRAFGARTMDSAAYTRTF